MSNTGIHRTHMDGLWTEPAFRELIASEAHSLWESALALEGIPIRISTSHLAEVLKKHVAESHLRELYRPEFLNGVEFEPILAVIHKDEPDTVTTIHDYAEDSRLASALCHIFPDRIIHCEWFIDGLGEGGEYDLYGEHAKERLY